MTYALQVRDDARLAGRVLRYHTWPHIKQQSVGEHSWQLLRILLKIWPSAPAHVLSYVVRHDCGELTTGDAPYPVKKDNPILAGEMNRIEADGLQLQIDAGFLADSTEISEDERWAVKLAEFIEMWEWAREEQLLGNRFAELVDKRCYGAIWDRIRNDVAQDLPEFRKTIALEAKQYVKRREILWEI